MNKKPKYNIGTSKAYDPKNNSALHSLGFHDFIRWWFKFGQRRERHYFICDKDLNRDVKMEDAFFNDLNS